MSSKTLSAKKNLLFFVLSIYKPLPITNKEPNESSLVLIGNRMGWGQN